MRAHRADIGSVFSDVDMSAIAAFPNGIAVSRKHDAFLDVAEQLFIAFLVRLFDCRYAAEQTRDVGKSATLAKSAYISVHS